MSDRHIDQIKQEAINRLRQIDPEIESKILDIGVAKLQGASFWLQITFKMNATGGNSALQQQLKNAIPRQINGMAIKKTIEFVTPGTLKHLSRTSKSVTKPNQPESNQREPNQLWILEADAKASVMIKTKNTFQSCDGLLCSHAVDEIERESGTLQNGTVPFNTKLKGRLEHFPSNIIVRSFADLASDIALAQLHLSKNADPDRYKIANVNPDLVQEGKEIVYFYNQYDEKITGKVTRVDIECPDDGTKNLLRLSIEASPGDSGSALFVERDHGPEIIGMILCKYENGEDDLVYAANLMHVKEYLHHNYYKGKPTSLKDNIVYLFSKTKDPVKVFEGTSEPGVRHPKAPFDFYKIFHARK